MFGKAKQIPDESDGMLDNGGVEGFSDGLPVPMSSPTEE